MFKIAILSLVLLQNTSQSLSLARIHHGNPMQQQGGPAAILTEQSFGMNLARHQTPEYSDEVKSRDAQFMSHSFAASQSQSPMMSPAAQRSVNLDQCKDDRKCSGNFS